MNEPSSTDGRYAFDVGELGVAAAKLRVDAARAADGADGDAPSRPPGFSMSGEYEILLKASHATSQAVTEHVTEHVTDTLTRH